jgi:hypothetical protein
MVTRMTVRIRSRKIYLISKVKVFFSLPSFLSFLSFPVSLSLCPRFSLFLRCVTLISPLTPSTPQPPSPVPFPSTTLSLSLARPPLYFSSFAPPPKAPPLGYFLTDLLPFLLIFVGLFFLFLSTQYEEALLSLTRSARASPPASPLRALPPRAQGEVGQISTPNHPFRYLLTKSVTSSLFWPCGPSVVPG